MTQPQAKPTVVWEWVAVMAAALAVVAVILVFQWPGAVGRDSVAEERDRLAAELDTATVGVAALEQDRAVLQESLDEALAALEQEREQWFEEKAKTELERDLAYSEMEKLTVEVSLLRTQIGRVVEQKNELIVQLDTMTGVTGAGTAVNPPSEAVPAVGRAPGDVATRVLYDVRVVKASRAIDYVVLDVGSDHGVLPGMLFSVMDGDRPFAQLRALDVREDKTGASVDTLTDDRYPAENDRAILRRQALQ